jgi:hypothetical protein
MFTTVLDRDQDPYLVDIDPEPPANFLFQLTTEAAAEEHDAEPGGLPPGLDSWLPTPHLAAVLSVVSPDELSGHDRITLLKAQQRLVSHFQAKSYETMESVHEVMTDFEGDESDFAFRMASAEIRAALHQTARAADAELSIALDLTADIYAPVLQALENGLLDRRRAGLIVHRTSHLDPDTTRSVVGEIMNAAPGMTSGELIARIDELNLTLGPEEAKAHLEEGLSQRRVCAEKNWDGTGNYMGLHLPPEKVAAAQRRINHLAKQLKTDTEARTMDQLRADIYLDLLTGAKPSTKEGVQASEGAKVDIQVPITTLTGETETPGVIPGWGPVLADTARQLVAEQEDGQWRVTVVDPNTGRPLAAVTTRRRPTNHQTRQIQALRPVCAMVGCRNPAQDCDLDHRIPWAEDGPTSIDHLYPLCRGDHIIRHLGWTYQINPDGTITWTSRLGHKYIKRPWRPP